MAADTLTDLAAYAGLIVSAFTSATLLPESSEAALFTLLAFGRGGAGLLVVVATVGTVLGSCINWVLGRSSRGFATGAGFPSTNSPTSAPSRGSAAMEPGRCCCRGCRVIGDPLTAFAGALRVDLLRFVVLVSLGKAARYGFILAAFDLWNG